MDRQASSELAPSPSREPFREVLTRVERAVVAPIVPGELPDWCANVLEHLAALARVWSAQRREHAGIFEGIIARDPGLGHRVAHMHQTEAQLQRELSGLCAGVRTMAGMQAETHGSWEPRDAGYKLRERLLQFIVDCRALESEVDTWYVESRYRDRGEID